MKTLKLIILKLFNYKTTKRVFNLFKRKNKTFNSRENVMIYKFTQKVIYIY